jgi:1-acyl-sn-glycerol-3-phosphate acyltransferase
VVSFVNWFTKITGWIAQFFCFRTKITYEDKSKQSRKIKGKAIIISNHTSVYDYAVMLFVFFGRTLRYQMAEVLFKKKGLGKFLHALGAIKVDRDTFNFSFMHESEEILNKGGVVGIFPESRLPRQGEERPLPFKPSAAYLALLTGAKVIPVYTNGSYFNKKRARVIIGTPIDISEIAASDLTEKEKIEKINGMFRDKIINLRGLQNEGTKQKA